MPLLPLLTKNNQCQTNRFVCSQHAVYGLACGVRLQDRFTSASGSLQMNPGHQQGCLLPSQLEAFVILTQCEISSKPPAGWLASVFCITDDGSHESQPAEGQASCFLTLAANGGRFFTTWVWAKLNHPGTAGFGPGLHLLGFHLGYLFLTTTATCCARSGSKGRLGRLGEGRARASGGGALWSRVLWPVIAREFGRQTKYGYPPTN